MTLTSVRVNISIKNPTSTPKTSIRPYLFVPIRYLITCFGKPNVTISVHHELAQSTLNKEIIKDPNHYMYIEGSTRSEREANVIIGVALLIMLKSTQDYNCILLLGEEDLIIYTISLQK